MTVEPMPYRRGQNGPASGWTPRQALLDALRAIDAGELDPQLLIVCMGVKREEEDGSTACLTYFRCSSPDPYSTVGLLRLTEKELLS